MKDCAKNHFGTLLLMIGFGMIAGSLEAQSVQFPYQGLVVSQEAFVYSGPGKMHYTTDVLKPGELVKVFRHDLDGWCAIRPPLGSFSLVPEAAVKLTGNGYGEITEANVQAWVGTARGAVEKPLWQVKMKLGEEVQLLGEVSWPDPEGHSTIWYQIAPPNGEFRWIHIDDIKVPNTQLPEEFDETPNEATDQSQGPIADYEERNQGWRPAKIPFEEQGTIQLASAEQVVQNSDQQSSNGVLGQVQTIPVETFDEKPNENGFVTPNSDRRQFESPQDQDPIGPLPREISAGSNTRQRPQRPERYASANSAFGGSFASEVSALNTIAPLGDLKLTKRLQEIDMRLSAEVTKPLMANWNLTNIVMDTQTVLNSAISQAEANAAKRLLDKINNFRRIQEQANSVEGRARAASPFSTSVPAMTDEKPSSLYDAQGWLNELVLKRGTVESTYVLEDDQGRITHHVQAAPGLNLHRYLRSKIGIIGQRGFHQQLNLNHILVERLIVLEKPRK